MQYLWSRSSDNNLDTHPGWLSIAFPILLRDKLFSRLRTSCNASFPAASFPLHSVARARWLVSKVDTCRAKSECSRSSTIVPKIPCQNWWWLQLSTAFIITFFFFMTVYLLSSCSHMTHLLDKTWNPAHAMAETLCLIDCASEFDVSLL